MGFDVEIMFAELLFILEDNRFKGFAVTKREAELAKSIYFFLKYACECDPSMRDRIDEIEIND